MANPKPIRLYLLSCADVSVDAKEKNIDDVEANNRLCSEGAVVDGGDDGDAGKFSIADDHPR